MARRTIKRYLAMCLAVVMLLTVLPVGVYAADGAPFEDGAAREDLAASGSVDLSVEPEEAEPDVQPRLEPMEDAAAITAVSDYAAFLSCLKDLERYARSYAAENPTENVNALIINFIRTGVERYTSGTWEMVCGKENTAFTAYVAEQDAANGTSASALKNLENFNLPNGNYADLGHMFGAMDVANYAKVQGMTDAVVLARADMGSWAGDIADLMFCAENVEIPDKVDTSETDVELLSANIRVKYLGADFNTLNEVDHSFTNTDLYGDLDAFYLTTEMNRGGSLSVLAEDYFTAGLTDESRASYFLRNRLGGMVTKEGIRSMVLKVYSANTLIGALESSYSLTDLPNCETLRKACCYAFADYLFDLAGDPNGTDPIDPDPDPEPEPEPENPYYSVFSSDTTTVAPGVTQTINYALTTDEKQIVYYIATVDISREDVSVHANYHANDPSQGWAMARVTDQMAAAQARHSDPSDPENYVEHYNAVLGTNADFYNMTNGAPSGILYMEGVKYLGNSNQNFFAILKDGTAIIGAPGDYAAYESQIQEAVGGSIFLVRDGEAVVKHSETYYNSRHSRTCVGITADGKVIMMVLDGRQEPFSAGGSAEELAQIMLDAGCVTAINLDGGGSTTFVAKQEGSDELTIVNRPSDGYERSVSSSLLVVSTAPSSKEFDHALVTSAYDYLTKGASVSLIASGVSATGSPAELPADITWKSLNEDVGTVSENGVFTAAAEGTAEVQLLSGETVIGSKTLTVVEPTGLKFAKASVNAIYGKAVELPLIVTYNENPVAICPDDITFELSNNAAGAVEERDGGFVFTGIEESGLRNVTITAMITRDYSISASIKVAMYSESQAIFDFDNATSGDRTFAWTREVTNAEYIPGGDDMTDRYHVIDPGQPMDITYVFGLDMMTIKVPEKLEPLLSMVAGGDIADITAWDLLLQLAERVSKKTEVTVKFRFDPKVNVDISGLTVSNDYFSLTSAEVDENNVLTVKCNFIKQSQAIAPETANPICILSGVKMSIKDDAQWGEDQTISIANAGSIGYDIYLGANALYSMACQTSFQEQYGIYPYEEPENVIHPKGGHFYCESYQDFTDKFILDRGSWTGWKMVGGVAYYFVDNAALKGIHKVPGLNDEQNEYFYRFNETTGASEGKITGLFELDGAWYYAIKGAAKSGWWNLTDADGESGYYYFSPADFKAVDENQTIDGYKYVFENCKLVRGDFVKDSGGTHYRWAGEWLCNKWLELDGNKYYLGYGPHGYVETGIFRIYEYATRYAADENGVWQEHLTGLFDYNGETYYCVQGIIQDMPGLVKIEGSYYYFRTSTSTAVKGRTYWITVTNGLLPVGQYAFDETGKMIDPPAVEPDPDPKPEPDPEVKNGIVSENGSLYYYENGALTGAGLIRLDGDYYYVKTSNAEVVHGRTYWITVTNGLLPAGLYNFADDGKMIDPPVVDPTPDPDPEPTPDPDPEPEPDPKPDVKNGIVAENGSLYYYVDGKLTGAGLIRLGGDYYYVKTSNCEVVHGRSYWVTLTNGLLPAGQYAFADDGKMIDPPVVDPTPDPDPEPEPDPKPDVKNGIVAENGSLYYYVDGKLTGAGLIRLGGDYYYVKTSNCEVVHGRSYWVTLTNGLLPAGLYSFADDGKMVR